MFLTVQYKRGISTYSRHGGSYVNSKTHHSCLMKETLVDNKKKDLTINNYKEIIPGPVLQWPVRAIWYITDQCNLECPYCLNDSSPEPRQALGTRDIGNITNILCDSAISNVALLGGEPLCSPSFTDICTKLVASRISVQLVTNGFLINDKILCFLKSLGSSLDWIQLSLHRRDASMFYSSLIKRLVSANICVHTLMVLSSEDCIYVPDIFEMVAQAGASSFIITKIGELGRAADGRYRGHIPSTGDLAKIVLQLRHIQQEKQYDTEPTFKHRGLVSQYINNKYGLNILSNICKAGISEFHIRADGRCQPCCFITDSETDKYTTIGLHHLNNLDEMWNGEIFERFRRDKIYQDTSPVLSSCKSCLNHINNICRPCLIHPSGCISELKIVKENLMEYDVLHAHIR